MVGRPEDRHKLKFNPRRGVWEVRWTDPGPRSRAVSTGTQDFAQAQVFLAEWRTREKILARSAGEPLVRELLDTYEDDARARGVSDGTFYAVARVREFFGAMRPSTITAAGVRDYSRQRGVSDGTIIRELNALKAALALGVRTKALRREDVPDIPVPARPQGRVAFLDEIEESEFHALAMGLSVGRARLTRLTRFVGLAMDTGARKGALLGLTWDRVDLVRGQIDFREPGRALSNKRRSLIPINIRLRPLLDRARTEATDRFVVGEGDIKKAWQRWIVGTPYSWVTPHTLRHTFATLNIRAGVDVRQVAAMLGDDPVTVMRTYAHVSPGWLVESINKRFQT